MTLFTEEMVENFKILKKGLLRVEFWTVEDVVGVLQISNDRDLITARCAAR